MDIQKFIVENALIVVPALWVLGTFLKQSPKIQDWIIPWLLLVCGIAFTVSILGVNPDAVLQGILVSGMAVLGHQLLKQTVDK